MKISYKILGQSAHINYDKQRIKLKLCFTSEDPFALYQLHLVHQCTPMG